MARDTYPDAKEMKRRRTTDPVFSDQARLRETDPTVLLPAASRTGQLGPKPTAQVARLAERLGKSPDDLAAEIPPDTLRRTRYPLIEERVGDKRIFRHDEGIVEGITSLARL